MLHAKSMILYAAILAVGTGTAASKDNPMWRKGLIWTCHFTDVIQCERSQDCRQVRRAGSFTIDYPDNRVAEDDGVVHGIRRHYAQSVSGSPIAAEVKIELDSNDVVWVLPADPAGMFSNNWIGAMVSPRAGVVVQELRPITCQPRQ